MNSSCGVNNININNKESSLVQLYGDLEKGIVSNYKVYENIIKSDEFKKLSFKDKMLVAFGRSGTSRHTENKILEELNYKLFKFESQVTIPLLSEFFHNEEDKNNNINSNNQQENCTIENSFKDFVNHIRSFLASLEDNKVYKIIPCIKERQSDGEFQVKTITTGIIVSKNTDVINICEKLKFDINSCIHKYGFDNIYCEFGLMFKEWLTDDDFFGSFVKVEEVINEIIKDSNKINKISGKKELTDITKRISNNYQGKYVDIIMGEYGEKVLIGNKELFKLSIKDVDHYFDVPRTNSLW